MTIRRPLQTQLLKAWRTAISEHYTSCQINSERSLQASLWGNLIAELPPSRRTFIEPRIHCETDTAIPKLFPDLIVCNSRSVIAVIELKYTPRMNPQFKKDLRTLNWLATNKSTLYVENTRYLGQNKRQHRYVLADHVLFGWASVHKFQNPHRDARNLASDYPALSNCFVELHAETKADSDPITGLTRN